jgi:aminopeptidase 2
MLSEIVGEEAFLKGVSLYLKKKQFSNGVTGDLLDGISEASGRDVKEIARNWTTKVGFPVVSATATADGKVKVRQDRFLATGDVKDEENETLWFVRVALVPPSRDQSPDLWPSGILSTGTSPSAY